MGECGGTLGWKTGADRGFQVVFSNERYLNQRQATAGRSFQDHAMPEADEVPRTTAAPLGTFATKHILIVNKAIPKHSCLQFTNPGCEIWHILVNVRHHIFLLTSVSTYSR